jgi:hypothetical protein
MVGVPHVIREGKEVAPHAFATMPKLEQAIVRRKWYRGTNKAMDDFIGNPEPRPCWGRGDGSGAQHASERGCCGMPTFCEKNPVSTGADGWPIPYGWVVVDLDLIMQLRDRLRDQGRCTERILPSVCCR